MNKTYNELMGYSLSFLEASSDELKRRIIEARLLIEIAKKSNNVGLVEAANNVLLTGYPF